VLTAALLAAGALAVQNWETWLPRAEELGRMAMTEVERQNRNEELERALREATEQLPHLAPETIRLILSASPSGALDPPEIFRVASDAADRGRPALTPGEAAELKALRSQLLDKVLRAQRERVDEYDRTRARRAVFPFEDRAALDVTVSGFRKIPQPSQERLQTLLGKAIAAGLARPAEGAAHAAPKH
jgi:hypothetical protein